MSEENARKNGTAASGAAKDGGKGGAAKKNGKKKDKIRGAWIYPLIYFFGRLYAIIHMKRHFSYVTDKVPKMDGPCIVMCNHTTEVDMMMVMAACRKPMYFVCGEHLFRSKAGKPLVRFGNPIPASRGGSTILRTIREITKRIKAGFNVMIFPEGCRSFNGETLNLEDSAGKLVKMAKCGLVTYRSHGGYFVAPRWSYHFREGHCWGEVRHVYTAEEVSKMSAAELTKHINEDLHENAYEIQKAHPYPYTAKEGLAEGLENYLFICPKCGTFDRLETKGNDFRCPVCGLAGTHDDYAMLKGKDGAELPFDNVYDWGKWTEQEFDRLAKDYPENEVLFTETDLRLYEIDDLNHDQKDLFTGEMKVYKDRMEIGGHVFDYAGIKNSSLLYYGKSILFTHTSGYFGITGEHFHAYKANRLLELWNS